MLHASALHGLRFVLLLRTYLGLLGILLGSTLVSQLLEEAVSEKLGRPGVPEERLVRAGYPAKHFGRALVLELPCCVLLCMGFPRLVTSSALGYVEEPLVASNPILASSYPA